MKRYVQFNSWNRYARRFVTAPMFTWEPVEHATRYRIGIAAVSQRRATWFETRAPSFDFGDLWDQLPFKRIDMLVIPLDDDGNEVDKPSYDDNMAYKPILKSPGWKGGTQEPLDWEGAIRRSMAWLLLPARDRVEPFEEGLPRHVWSATEDSYSGERHIGGEPGRMNSYPTLHFPTYISSFLRYAEAFSYDELAGEARRQALQCGDWLLNHHHPGDWVCGGFPYSCIAGGKLEETHGATKGAITVFRVAAVGEVMLHLGELLDDDEYTDYGVRLAKGLRKLQREDGSWPFRVDPKTGEVVQEYTSNVVTPARLFALLKEDVAGGLSGGGRPG